MKQNVSRDTHDIVRKILINCIRRSLVPLDIVQKINTNKLESISEYEVLCKAVQKEKEVRIAKAKKIVDRFDIDDKRFFSSDVLSESKKQKIRFFVNVLYAENNKMGKIIRKRKIRGKNSWMEARVKDGRHIIMQSIPKKEGILRYSNNGFYQTMYRDIIYYFLKNNAENLLGLWGRG